MKTYKQYNEGVRDLMTPKSDEEQRKGFDKLGPMSVLNYGNRELIPWVIDYALNRGADPNLRFKTDNIEMTPLEHAALKGNMEVVKVLLKHNNVRITRNAIGNAIYKGHKDIVDILNKNAKPGLAYESLRDKMTPRSKEDIVNMVDDLPLDRKVELMVKDERDLEKILGKKYIKEEIFKHFEDLDENTQARLIMWHQGELQRVFTVAQIKEFVKKFSVYRLFEILTLGTVTFTKAEMREIVKKELPNISSNDYHILRWSWIMGDDITRKMVEDKCNNLDILRKMIKDKLHYRQYWKTDLFKKEKTNEGVRDKMIPKSEDELLNSDMSPNKLLMGSIENKWLEGVEAAIVKGADVNEPDSKGDTPLYKAVTNHFLEAVQLLLAFDANINARNNFGETSFYNAVYFGNIKIVKELIKHNPDPNVPNQWRDDILDSIDVPGDQYSDEHDELVKIVTDYVNKYNKVNKVNESVRDKMTGKDINVIDKKVYDRMNRYPKLGTFDWKKWGWTIDYEDIYGTSIDSYFFIDSNDKKYLINLTEDNIELRVYPYKVGKKFSNYEDLDDYLDFYYNERTTYYDKFKKKTNESLQDSLTGKPIEHITKVGKFRRYNFIEDWANHEKYRNHVGYIVIDDGCDLFLSSFTIWEPYKGKGLGRKYLNIILDELKKFDKYPWVGLSVKKDNEIAIKLYRSVGFRNESEVSEYDGPGKNYKSDVYYYMVKENK